MLNSSQSATIIVTKRICADSHSDFIALEVLFVTCEVFATCPYTVLSLHFPQQLSLNAVYLIDLGVTTASSWLGSVKMNYLHATKVRHDKSRNAQALRMSLLSRGIKRTPSRKQLWMLTYHCSLHVSQLATSNMTKSNCDDSYPNFIVPEAPFVMCLVFSTSPYAACSLCLRQKLSLNEVDLILFLLRLFPV